MKNVLIIFLVITFGLSVSAQEPKDEMETVYVDKDMSYIIVDGAIYAHGIGNESDFKAVAYEQSLMIRARPNLPDGTISNVFLVYGDETYKQYRYAQLIYRNTEEVKEYYDWRSDIQKDAKSIKAERLLETKLEVETKEMELAMLKTRAQSMKNYKDEIEDVGILNNDIVVLTKVVRHDDDYGYIKFLFQNKGSVNYEFDRISFQYMQRYKQQGMLRRKKEKPYEVFPLVEPDVKHVEGNSESYLIYVVPLFGLSEVKKEFLLVTFREKHGDRKVELRINPDVIMDSKKFE
jgi:Domain of unknown function (DUF4138)